MHTNTFWVALDFVVLKTWKNGLLLQFSFVSKFNQRQTKWNILHITTKMVYRTKIITFFSRAFFLFEYILSSKPDFDGINQKYKKDSKWQHMLTPGKACHVWGWVDVDDRKPKLDNMGHEMDQTRLGKACCLDSHEWATKQKFVT